MKRKSYILIIIGLLVVLNTQFVFGQKRADAGADTVNCMGKGVQIGGPENSDYCYSWTPTTGLDNPNTANPKANPTTKTTYTVTVIGPDFTFKETDDVDVSVLNSATFKKDPSQKYGYDDWSKNSSDGCCSSIDKDWKSVKVGDTDPAVVEVPAGEDYKFLHLKSKNISTATVTPAKAASASQTLTIRGVSGGETEIQGNCAKEDGETLEVLKIASYNPQVFSVAVVLVHEENDDVQVIPVGRGKPNEVVITAGSNGTINTTPAGDDVRVGSTITAGVDGICQTSASGDDVQVIPVGRGKANQIGVGRGANSFRDTVTPGGDDVIAGDNINTGANGICETTANNTNTNSAFYSNYAAVTSFANDVYRQAATQMNFTRLPDVAVNFDLDRDGFLTVSSSWPVEMAAVRDNVSIPAGYDVVIYLADNLTYPGLPAGSTLLGIGPFGSNKTFIDGGRARTQTTAHELGHAVFSLRHPSSGGCVPTGDGSSNYSNDNDNVMGYCSSRNTFRKFQWDQINP